MQIFALDEKRIASASEAEKRKDYRCPECAKIVRLRKGSQRQSHFFHLARSPSCRLAQKGMIHLQLQYYIKNLFLDAIMECPFPSINRIADVAHHPSKKIFEIQYSPMSLEKAKERCADYESLGYTVIWILHDHRFNQTRLTPAEKFLRTKTCYFSNMNEKREGFIYDQLEEVTSNRRQSTSHPKPINLACSIPVPSSAKWPPQLAQRAATWPYFHEGDLIDAFLKGATFSKPLPPKKLLTCLRDGYLALLYIFLEKSSQ